MTGPRATVGSFRRGIGAAEAGAAEAEAATIGSGRRTDDAEAEAAGAAEAATTGSGRRTDDAEAEAAGTAETGAAETGATRGATVGSLRTCGSAGTKDESSCAARATNGFGRRGTTGPGGGALLKSIRPASSHRRLIGFGSNSIGTRC